MLKIKLARFGKRHQPHFRIVINEARDKRDGKYVESIGHYAPTQSPKLLQIDLEAYDAWLKKGAQPTETVAGLVERMRSGKGFEAKKKISKKAKTKQSALAAEAAEAKAAKEAEKAQAKAAKEEVNSETVETPPTE